jgi:2-dehydropantoate 2-reductase
MPLFLSGICSAGVYTTKPFTIVHAGKGPLVIGPVVENAQSNTELALANSMVHRLSQASTLEATLVSAEAIQEVQLRKLAVNAVINPLTAILRCQNGKLINNPDMFAAAKLLLEETAAILRAQTPHLRDTFSDQHLLDSVVAVAEKTQANTSSMLQDIKAGQWTEIDYINGYLIRLALELGLPCPYNKMMAELVAEKRDLEADDLLGRFLSSCQRPRSSPDPSLSASA